MSGIEFSNVSYHYQQKMMFSHLNLRIPANAITCLVGPNGSGKSTLLKLMAGLLLTHQGNVLLDNINIKTYQRNSLAKKLAYLPQQCHIPPSLSVREYVALGRFCHQSWFARTSKTDEKAIENAISLTHLSTLANQAVSTLSVGQQQRARIALMLAQEAEYLLLDEPMTGLDFKQQLNMLSLLTTLQKEHGKTIIVILHDLAQAKEISNEVILLKESCVVGQGRPQNILCEELLLKAFDLDCISPAYTL